MNRYIALIMSQLFLCPAFADYVIFSQYDGINKWENVYIPVDNANDYVKPGVGYHPIQYGHDTPAQVGRDWVTPSKFRAYYSGGGGRGGNYLHDTFTKASESSTFYDRRTREFFLGGTTTPFLTFNDIVTDPTWSLSNLNAYDEVLIDEISSQVEREGSWEQTILARAIVVVETHEDMEDVIEGFFK
jgi:hypothetical protein